MEVTWLSKGDLAVQFGSMEGNLGSELASVSGCVPNYAWFFDFLHLPSGK